MCCKIDVLCPSAEWKHYSVQPLHTRVYPEYNLFGTYAIFRLLIIVYDQKMPANQAYTLSLTNEIIYLYI